jgi:hypothetical protein
MYLFPSGEALSSLKTLAVSGRGWPVAARPGSTGPPPNPQALGGPYPWPWRQRALTRAAVTQSERRGVPPLAPEDAV